MHAPLLGNQWIQLTDAPLPVGVAYEWAVTADCGAVVLFSGTVRDHSLAESGEMRTGVTRLTYEAYDGQVEPKMQAIVDELRLRWPTAGRVVLLHRTGDLLLGESSVLVVVGAPHRPQAFEAARYAIDALKASVPIWKREAWDGGSDWGTGAHQPIDAQQVPTA